MKTKIILGIFIFILFIVLGFGLFRIFNLREDGVRSEKQLEYIDNKEEDAQWGKETQYNKDRENIITDGYNSKDEFNPFKLHNEYDEYDAKDDLYEIVYNNYWLFINKNGDVILRFPKSKYQDAGRFSDGRAFLGKNTKIIDYDGDGADLYYKITYLTIIDKKGEIIKIYDKPALVMDFDGETAANYMPEFYKGYAKINFITNDFNKINKYSKAKTKETYVNLDGEVIKKSKIDPDILKILDNDMFPMLRFKVDFNFVPEATKCVEEFSEWDECFTYFDKESKVALEPKYNSEFVYCGDWYSENPMFYNGIAKAFYKTSSKDSGYIKGYYYFINKRGEAINKSHYEYAEPFYKKITIVIDGKTGERAYINRDGKIVWSDKIQEARDKK